MSPEAKSLLSAKKTGHQVPKRGRLDVQSGQENLVFNLVHSRTRTRPCQITSKYIQVHPTAIVHHPPRVQVVNIKFFWFWALNKQRNDQDEGDDGILASRYCTILY
jgi:hypothetical protein